MELLLKLAEININANIMMIKEIPMNYMPNIVIQEKKQYNYNKDLIESLTTNASCVLSQNPPTGGEVLQQQFI